MSPRRPSDDELLDPFGDELDFAQTIARENPTADELQHFANLRSAKHALLESQAKFVRNNPVSVLKGSLGNQVDFSGAVDEVKQVAAWVGDVSETLPVTVTFGGVNPTYPGATGVGAYYGDQQPYGIVQFGTQGSLITLEVDINAGCQFTVGASMVTLQVGMRTYVRNPTATPVPRVFTGMLSFHPVVRTAPVTRTLYYNASYGVTVLSHDAIPNFAKQMLFLPADVVLPGAGTLVFYDASGYPIYYRTIAVGNSELTPITIPGDAVSFSVGALAVAGTQYPGRAVFILDL